MNYKLVAIKKESNKIIDLSSVISDSKKLESIDSFTCGFKDEETLKIHLIGKELLDPRFLDAKLKITYTYKSEDKELPVRYSYTKKYSDILVLKYEFYGLTSDQEFLQRLVRRYSYLKTPGSPLGYIHEHMMDVERYGGVDFPSNLFYNAREEFFKQIIIRYNSKKEQEDINYKGMRDFIVFLSNYIKGKKLKREKEALIGTQDEQLKLI